MAYAFDSLGYAKRLREAGVPSQQAEAHAEAARDFVMAELVTKTDLNAAIAHLNEAINHVDQRIDSTAETLNRTIDTQTLRLTVRLGGMIAIGIAILAAIQKLGS
jgi:hypothetical protein